MSFSFQSTVPQPEHDLRPFLMPIEDVFTITGRGTVVTGRVERGVINLNDEVEIIGHTWDTRTSVVTGIEMNRKLLDCAGEGDHVGLLLRGIQRNEVEKGQILCRPGSVRLHTRFLGQVYVNTKDEGGRHTPIFNNYRPCFCFRTDEIIGVITLPEGVEMCMPGDSMEMEVGLIHPVAMEDGLKFDIREGDRFVGRGEIIMIIE